ncbi:MAG: DUF2490 domain-containing protein [Acidobacteriota bacterium]|nr:DUF2490 domain-containing protein [Acidobacteriota bacterium]
MSPLQFKHRNNFLILFFLLLFFTFPIFSQAKDDEPRNDNQFRGEVEVAVPIYKELYLTLGSDLRLGQVAENRFVRSEAGFLYKQKIGKYFTVMPRYRYRAEQLFNGASETENRLSADGIASFKIQKFAITDNNLFEFRFRRSGNSQRYRNRLKVLHPVTVGKTSIDLFASDEVYYEWEERAWTRNRFKVGFGKEINERAGYEIYYMRQDDGFSRPGDLHVFGIEFEIETKKLFRK